MDPVEPVRKGYRVYEKAIRELSRLSGHSRNTLKKAVRGQARGHEEQAQ